jgi:hypothetical protein
MWTGLDLRSCPTLATVFATAAVLVDQRTWPLGAGSAGRLTATGDDHPERGGCEHVIRARASGSTLARLPHLILAAFLVAGRILESLR